MRPALLLVLPILLGGCIVQAGGHAGTTMHSNSLGDRDTFGGQLKVRGDLGQVNVPLQVGLELEGRGEQGWGSLLLGGINAGLTAFQGQPIALGLSGEGGVPISWDSPLSGVYYGLTVEAPIHPGQAAPSDVNRNYRFLHSSLGMAPYLRLRMLRLRGQGPSAKTDTSYEVVMGLSIRMGLRTDLF